MAVRPRRRDLRPRRRARIPFARDPAGEAGRDAASATLGDFRIVGNRIFCLRGDQSILAFDGDSGLLDWSYTPTSGRINPHLHRRPPPGRAPGPQAERDPGPRHRHRPPPRRVTPRPTPKKWPRDPLPIDDDHVALVTDRMTVALFDLARGRNAWVFRETTELPRYGPPRLLGDAERILVLHDGRELIRLDPATGAKGWGRLLGSDDLSDRPESIALSGRPGVRRQRREPGGPLAARRLDPLEAPARRPLGGPLGRRPDRAERGRLSRPPRGQARNTSAPSRSLLHRRDDGEPIQRLLFQGTVSDLAVRFSARGGPGGHAGRALGPGRPAGHGRFARPPVNLDRSGRPRPSA